MIICLQVPAMGMEKPGQDRGRRRLERRKKTCTYVVTLKQHAVTVAQASTFPVLGLR